MQNFPRSVQNHTQCHTLFRETLSQENNTAHLNPLSFFTMGNKKNIRKRIPTVKKLAADSDSPPHQNST